MGLKIPVDEREPTITIEDESIIVPAISPYRARLAEVPSSGEGVKLRRITATAKTGTGSGDCASGGYFTGLLTRNYKIEIDTGGDIGGGATFKWSNDGGTAWQGTLIPIEDEEPYDLELGVSVSFTPGAGTDFVLGDYWEFDAEYWTEGTAIPTGSMEFQVDYASGMIEFYSGDAGKTVYATYEGRGSLVKSSDLEQIIDILNRGEVATRNVDTSAFEEKQLVGVSGAGGYAVAQPGPDGSIVPAIGFVRVVDETEGEIQLFGPMDGFEGLTPNTKLYLVADGGISATPPETGGWIKQVVGRAMSTTRLLVKVSEDYTTN